MLPKELDEEVARAHLAQLNVKLTTMTAEQSSYLDIPAQGPYKPVSGSVAIFQMLIINLSPLSHTTATKSVLNSKQKQKNDGLNEPSSIEREHRIFNLLCAKDVMYLKGC